MGHYTFGEQMQIDTDLLKATSLFIAMPCFGSKLEATTFMSFLGWGNLCHELGIKWQVECVGNESLITRARNISVSSFLGSRLNFTHLMFIDSDITFEPWHLLSLLSRDKDVVGGLYTAKTFPTRVVANHFLGEATEDGMHEVRKTGTGFLMIKRHVFEKLDAHPSVLPFDWEIGIPPNANKNLKTYFDTSVRDGRYLSEDWFFCENWRDLGGKVWLDTNVQLGHTGSFLYGLGEQEELYRSLHGFYKETSVEL